MQSIQSNMKTNPIKYFCRDNGQFPNSFLPALLYKGILDISGLFPAHHIIHQFKENGWANAWKSGIFTYHHYHSTTHEVVGVYKGKTTLLLGGEKGHRVEIACGDMLIIPAGVAHKNLGIETNVKCVGAYPDGHAYDMNYGRTGERPETDVNIAGVSLPLSDPLKGMTAGVVETWSEILMKTGEGILHV
jgi:uncharacterized protein YjlB